MELIEPTFIKYRSRFGQDKIKKLVVHFVPPIIFRYICIVKLTKIIILYTQNHE